MFRFKMDATLAGRSYQAYGEFFPVYRFGTEIHTQSLYDNPETFDDADISDVIFDKKVIQELWITLNTLAELLAKALLMTKTLMSES